ncbi:tyrosine-type recombinase/integrase [Ensifer adhaerens]|uniref:tyrosine-type recombinase/integrase n=1 Tax=Ensifer adhaerens TaxID=106592 RepID=UPI0008074037|nr:tyrosine-type recombinase/integrase [Ensifer adhaerens]
MRKIDFKKEQAVLADAFVTNQRGMNFVIARHPVVRNGVKIDWPRLFIIQGGPDQKVSVSPVTALDEYFDVHHVRSQQWRKETCLALGLLIDHTAAIIPQLEREGRLNAGDQFLERRLLGSFAVALVNGTMSFQGGKLIDETGLYWKPKGHKRAGRLLSRLTHLFLTWEMDGGIAAWVRSASTSALRDDPVAALRMATELGIRRRKSLLAHLPGKRKVSPGVFPGIIKSQQQGARPIYSFPSRWVPHFLMEGFTNRNGETDETGQLIAFLLICGGLRMSEPFHLYVSDVQFMEDEPTVFLFNPEFGDLSLNGSRISRAEYLLRFGMKPRTKEFGRLHAGWKSMADDDVGTPVFWLPISSLKSIIQQKLADYILRVRPAVMSRRSARLGDHPFLFVNSGKIIASGGSEIGDPYSVSAFREAWKAAIKRIAAKYPESDLVYSKKRGTTPHGGRHYYGRFLRTLGLDGDYIQRCMHHRSWESHQIYTRLTPGELNLVLEQYERSSGNSISVLHDGMRSSLDTPPSHWNRTRSSSRS